MKTLFVNALIISVLTSCNPALAYDAVFVFSPYQLPKDATEQVKQTLQFLTQADSGYEALFVDGYNLKTLGAYKNPQSDSYKSPKARLNKNGAAVKALMDFAASAHYPSSQNPPRVIGALRLPQALRFAASALEPNTMADIVIFGSPIYDTTQDRAYSMFQGAIPSDGHLIATRGISPYGTSGEEDTLKNLRIHFGITDGSVLQSSQYAFHLERFWSLYVDRQGGKMVSFTRDVQSIIEGVKTKKQPRSDSYKINPNPKLEMVHFLLADLRDSIFFRPLSPYPVPRDQLHNVTSLVLALKWDCLCDLDLYARPFKSAHIVSTYNPDTPQGRHSKHFVLSDKKEWGFELIEFDIPVDLKTLEIVVNNFGGIKGRDIKGELRLAVHGKIFARNFTLAEKEYFAADGVEETFKSGKPANAYIMTFSAVDIVTTIKPSL